MQTAKRRRRTAWAIVASAVAHFAVGIVVVLQRPTLAAPAETGGPPEAVIPVLIMPRAPPATPGAKLARPSPIRLHRRPQPFLPPNAPTAPIAPPAPPAPAAALPAPAHAPVAIHPSPLPEGPKGDVRTALRQSAVACANPNATGLTRAERDHCNEVFGKGAKDAEFAGLGLPADKAAAFDRAAEHKEACRAYRAGGPQPPLREGLC